MTIDEMLVYIPQLTRQKDKLAEMAGKLPKSRAEQYGNAAFVDYVYLNYDPAEAEEEFRRVSDRLADAQLALDAVNAGVEFEI